MNWEFDGLYTWTCGHGTKCFGWVTARLTEDGCLSHFIVTKDYGDGSTTLGFEKTLKKAKNLLEENCDR